MIILPDRSAPVGRILPPMKRADWQLPSERAQPFGIPNQKIFTLTAYRSNGEVVWRGRFHDREDADAFLFALVSGFLPVARDLWWLPNPVWPDLDGDYCYRFVTTDVLTTTGGATYTVPSDFNSADNGIYVVGAGGSGGACRGGSGIPRNAAGGGGGAFSINTNESLTVGAGISYNIAVGGAAVSISTNIATAGNAGGQSSWNTTVIVALGGQGGEATSSSTDALGGAGGLASGGTGDFKYNGGDGGDVTNDTGGHCAAGGGGAAGDNGAGGAGTNNATVNSGSNGGQGGNGDGGAGGAGGSGTGGTGGNGTDFNVSGVGSGGGGGGRYDVGAGCTAGTGGNYGAGGGGCATTGSGGNTVSGAGQQGVIVVAYVPAVHVLTLAALGNYRKRVIKIAGY